MLAAVVRGDPHEVRTYMEDSVDINDATLGMHGNTGEHVFQGTVQRGVDRATDRQVLVHYSIGGRSQTGAH